MTDSDNHFEGLRGKPAPREPERADAEPRPRRRRIIGTPPPAVARRLLGLRRGGRPAEPTAGPPLRALGSGGEPPRPTEPVDPVRAAKAERVAALCFFISFLGSAGFVAAYVIFQVHSVDKAFRSNLWLGITMSVAFLAIAAGAVVWARNVMPYAQVPEARKPVASSPEDREAFATSFAEASTASQVPQRRLLRRTLLLALGPLSIVPLITLRDLGPLPHKRLRYTAWKKGTRLVVYGTNKPITSADFSQPGSLITVIPEGIEDDLNAIAKAATIIIKFRPGELKHPTVMNWTVDNIVAYSKICTHVGCPAALFEHTTSHILCPCHQSTFDATRGAKVIFGPAPRPLPQLPIAVNSEGYLVAQGDFPVPVGPSFWELG